MSLSKKKFEIEGLFEGFDHVHFYVGNAKAVAEHYHQTFGFEPIAFRGLETGHRDCASHVLKMNGIVFVFTSPYSKDSHGDFHGKSIGEHLITHGDGVKDVAFRVLDCAQVYNEALKRGAVSVREPVELRDDCGTVKLASLKTYGDTVHTLVERNGYSGVFLPGFQEYANQHTAVPMPVPDIRFVDHVVGNQPEGEMLLACDWYKEKLGFHRFWSVDDNQIHTQYSALRSIVMADESLSIKMPINEPAEGLKKSQIQEFVDFYGGPGVQHIALNTPNCVQTVERLRARGVEFLTIPEAYYSDLEIRLLNAKICVGEKIETLRRLHILVDFDDSGFLLQIFTKPLQDRPTVFFEIIQRAGNQGFGAGNFKALFQTIERDQYLRGNL